MNLHFINNDVEDVELKSVRLTIGRESENDITLEKDDISGFHAEIQKEGDRLYLIDLGSSNGTFHGGKRISGRVELKPWDLIAFASVKAEIVDPDSRRPTKTSPALTDDVVKAADNSKTSRRDDPRATKARPAATGWSLSGVSEDVKQQTVPISSSTTAGRDESCELTLPNELTSREHARLTVKDDRLTVADLGSTNGTWVNGKRITAPTRLNPGDELRFDTTTYRVQGADTGKTAVRKAVDDTSASTASNSADAVLRPDGGKPIRLAGSMSVGRLADNDIVLDDDTVSGHHARIEAKDGYWLLKDLGSSNGTTVAGRSVKEARLHGGERIGFGEVQLTLETARTGSTRHVKAIGASEGTGTRVQKAVGSGHTASGARSTVTSARSVPKRISSMPPWVWGVIGFAGVVLIAGIWMFRDQLGIPSQQIKAPLQAGNTWSRALGGEAGLRSVASTPAMADINGDDFLDLVIADTDGFVTALDGQEGKQIFEIAVSGRVLAAVATSDLTGDGAADIVIGTNKGQVVALNGSGQVLWQSDESLDLGEITNRAVFAQLNEDDIPDVVVPTDKRGLVALDGARGWEIWSTAEMSEGAVISSPVVADFNGDGAIDFGYVTRGGQAVAVSSAGSRVWRLWANGEVGTPNFASPSLIRVGKQSLMIVPVEDAIVALNAADGRMAWTSRAAGKYIASPLGLEVSSGDFHDVVVMNQDGEVRLLQGNTGDVIWETSLDAGVVSSPAAMDVSNDKIPDLIVQTQNGGLVALDSLRGRAIVTIDVGAGTGLSASPLLGDLTGDGLVEITVADHGGRVATYTMNRKTGKSNAVWPTMFGNDRHAVD